MASTVLVVSCNTQTKKETNTKKDTSSANIITDSNYNSDLIVPKLTMIV